MLERMSSELHRMSASSQRREKHDMETRTASGSIDHKYMKKTTCKYNFLFVFFQQLMSYAAVRPPSGDDDDVVGLDDVGGDVEGEEEEEEDDGNDAGEEGFEDEQQEGERGAASGTGKRPCKNVRNQTYRRSNFYTWQDKY